MPLVPGEGVEEQALDPAHAEARKIHPRYAKGELRRVAVGRNQAEAELIKGLLLEQGIPSMLRRTGGFDVPDFLAAGPRDVLVPESGVEAAREVLAEVGADDVPIEARQAAGDELPTGRSLELRLGAALLAFLLAFGAIAGAAWIFVR